MLLTLSAMLMTQAANPTPAAPPAFQKLISCRSIAGAQERLACFDREAAALQLATQRRDVVVVDRQQVRQTRRSLFGLTLPRLGIFEGSDDDAPQTVEGVVRSIATDRSGKWLIGLDDQLWRATEVKEFQATPRVGQRVTVRKGPLGSYLLSVEGRAAVRALRVR